MVLVPIKKLSPPVKRRWNRGDKITIKHSPDSDEKVEISNLEKEMLVKRKGKGLRLSNSFIDRHPPPLPMDPKYRDKSNLNMYLGDEEIEGGRTYAERLAARTRRIGEKAKRQFQRAGNDLQKIGEQAKKDLQPVKEFFQEHGEKLALQGLQTAIKAAPDMIKLAAGGEIKRRGRPKKGGALIASGAGPIESTVKRRLKM